MNMGVAAAERCDDFGWHPRGTIDPSLVAETAEAHRFGVGHAWSRSAGYALSTAPERMYLVLTVEGGFDFTVDGSTVRTGPGSLILLDGEAPTTARTVTDTARYVWYLEPTFLRAGRSRFRYGEPIPTGGTSVEALTSMTNAMVEGPAPRKGAVQHHLALAFENVLAGVLEEAGPHHKSAAAHRAGLFTAALTAIEENFRDPAFNVSRLAKELSTSARTLHEAFRGMGSTPRREIERRRVTEANRLAELGVRLAADLAAQTGFTTSRQLTRALHRTAGG